MKPILIVGPTASGKTELALRLAEREDAVVVNADALQVYDAWRVLSARPSDAEEARAPHALYGHVPVARPDYSVGAWLREVAPLLDQCRAAARTPIVVGGSGLNFSMLTKGLAEIPDVPDAVRAEADARLAELGLEGFFAELAALDPKTAEKIDRRNPRRLTRAWEVVQATGRGLADWAATTPPPLAPLDAARAVKLIPDRDALAARIDARLRAMVAAGALDEVAAVKARGFEFESALPGLKALGAREFSAHLDGALSLADAIDQAAAATRQYAKRQRTWARNQLGDWPVAADADAALRVLAS